MYREIYKTQRRGPDMPARGVDAHSAGGKARDASQQPKKKSTEALKKKGTDIPDRGVGAEGAGGEACSSFCVSIGTFVPVKPVN